MIMTFLKMIKIHQDITAEHQSSDDTLKIYFNHNLQTIFKTLRSPYEEHNDSYPADKYSIVVTSATWYKLSPLTKRVLTFHLKFSGLYMYIYMYL